MGSLYFHTPHYLSSYTFWVRYQLLNEIIKFGNYLLTEILWFGYIFGLEVDFQTIGFYSKVDFWTMQFCLEINFQMKMMCELRELCTEIEKYLAVYLGDSKWWNKLATYICSLLRFYIQKGQSFWYTSLWYACAHFNDFISFGYNTMWLWRTCNHNWPHWVVTMSTLNQNKLLTQQNNSRIMCVAHHALLFVVQLIDIAQS